MYLAHYLLPILVYLFVTRDKIVLFSLLIGNVIDLDHIFLRLNGTVPWFSSICGDKLVWRCSAFFGYPFHSVYAIVSLIVLSIILFFLMEKQKELKINKWMFWICIGILIHLMLDFVQLSTGVGFVISG